MAASLPRVSRGAGLSALEAALEQFAGEFAPGAKVRALLPRGGTSFAVTLDLPGDLAPAAILGDFQEWDFQFLWGAEDPKLRGVACVLGAKSLRELGLDSDRLVAKVRWHAYRPHRRAQLEVIDDVGDSWFVRVERPKRAERRAYHLATLDEVIPVDSGFVIPRLVSWDKEHGLFVMSALEGERLLDRFDEDGVRSLGRALREMHRLPVPKEHGLRTISWESAREDMDRMLRFLHFWEPERASALETCADRVVAKPPHSSGSCFVHGDLHEKQVLLGSHVGLLDFDQSAVADPGVDLGNLRAQFFLRRLQELDELEADALLHALREGYGPVPADLEERVLAWEAMALSRLAGVYALRPRWRRLSQDLVGRALELDSWREKHGREKWGGRKDA